MANQIVVTQSGNVQVSIEPTPNVQVQISRAAIGTVSNVPTANFANYAGNVTVASQPNITSLGTLTGLTVNGTANVTDLNVSGNLSVGNLVANSANYANFAGVANTANAVAVANVTGIGNIATINLDGNVSNVLSGNGTFVPLPTVSANANYANFAGTAFNVSGSNVTGAVANATYADNAGNATIANSANAVAGANVSGEVAFAAVANSVAGANVSGTVANATYAANAGHASTANTVTDNAQPNITSVGTLTGLSVNGNISANVITANTFVGNIALTQVDYIDFDTANGAPSFQTGRVYWDNAKDTLAIDMNAGGNITQQVGEDQYIYIKANATISAGQVVMFNGVQGDTILGAPANTASAGFVPRYVMGVAPANIASGSNGYVQTVGEVYNLQTNAFPAGSILYLQSNSNGAMTITEPIAPDPKIVLAACLTQSSTPSATNGRIQVRPDFGYYMNQLHNVSNVTATTGDVLVYNASNVYTPSNTVPVANLATYATTANSVAVANVVGIGNIASINLDGNVSNALLGDGSFGPVEVTSTTISNGTSNVNIPTANGNINFSTNGNANIALFDTAGALQLYPTTSSLNALRIASYGSPSANDTSRISTFRYRGNATTPLSVEPGDTTMRFLTAAYNGAGLQTSSIASIRAQVDATYTANGANIPLGWNLQVNDTNGGVNNQTRNHYFYSNGNVSLNRALTTDSDIATINGNITATNGVFYGNGAGLTNIPAGNLSGNLTYLNVVDSANVTGTIQQLAPNTITIATSSLNNTAYDLTTIYGESSNLAEPGQRAIIRARGNVSSPSTAVVSDVGARDRVYFYNGTTNALAFATSVVLATLNSNSNAYSTGTSYNISTGNPNGDQGNANAVSGLNLLQMNQNGQLVVLPGANSSVGSMLQTYSYGQPASLATAQGITMSRARGNRDANLSVNPGDQIGRLVFQAHNGTSFVTNRLPILRSTVDSTYVANTANIPAGFQMLVCDNTSFYTHNFYANGLYAPSGAITMSSGNLTMGPSQTIEVNRINQIGGNTSAVTFYSSATFNEGILSAGATFTGNSDVSIQGSSNGTPKGVYLGDFASGNLNFNLYGNFSQSKGNVFLGTSNIFIYNGGNSLTLQGVADGANGKYANLNFDGYGQIGQNMSVGGNLSVGGSLSITDLQVGNFTVGNYSAPHSHDTNLYSDVSIKGNVVVSGYDFFANTYSPVNVQFGYGNVQLQILDGNVQIGNANGNGGYLDFVSSRGRTQFYMQPTGSGTTIDMYAANGYISTTGTVSAANVAITSNGFVKLASYTASALNAITGSIGWTAAVSDSTPGGMLAYWDTTNSRWSYVHDNSAV